MLTEPALFASIHDWRKAAGTDSFLKTTHYCPSIFEVVMNAHIFKLFLITSFILVISPLNTRANDQKLADKTILVSEFRNANGYATHELIFGDKNRDGVYDQVENQYTFHFDIERPRTLPQIALDTVIVNEIDFRISGTSAGSPEGNVSEQIFSGLISAKDIHYDQITDEMLTLAPNETDSKKISAFLKNILDIASSSYYFNFLDAKGSTVGSFNANLDVGAELTLTQMINLDVMFSEISDRSREAVAQMYSIEPNPAADSFRIAIVSDILASKLEQVEIYSIDGERVFNTAGTPGRSIEVNCSSWAVGKYMIRFSGEGGSLSDTLTVIR